MRLLLASGSPRRRDLLADAGYEFDVLPVAVDEGRKQGEAPEEYVRRMASAKSARAVEMLGNRPEIRDREVRRAVLGADTVVVVNGRILGKPRDDDQARSMLQLLSGQNHEVVTGVSLRSVPKGSELDELTGVDTTVVTFSALSSQQIDWYVSTGEGRDKAGAYAIQGLASRFIPRIEGSYSNVVGLPIALVTALLGRLTRAT
jgi:septum formation protein